MNMSRWHCYIVGYVFLVSGIIKMNDSNFQVVFLSLGLPFPSTTLFLVAITEIACSMLIIGGMYVKQATLPLIAIISGAIYLTKWPIIFDKGILDFAFEARLDIIMLILLLLIGRYIPGKLISNPRV